MHSMAEKIVALPDRVVAFARTEAGVANDVEDLRFPGEMKKPKIREIATAAFGVSADSLLAAVAVAPNASPPVLAMPSRLEAALNQFLSKARKRADVRITGGLSFALTCDIVASALNEVRSAADRGGFASEPCEAFLLETTALELAKVGLDTVVFEANVAITHQLFERSDLESTQRSVEELHKSPEYLSYISEKYPLLVDRLRNRASAVACSIVRLVERLGSDLKEIATTFGLSQQAGLEGFESTSGDSHNQASNVCVVRFTDGSKIVYKPRSVSCEFAFQRFLDWLNSRDSSWSFGTIRVVSRTGYGWMEFVEGKAAESEAAVRMFYCRFGALIAVLHALGGTDIHFENLVASGSQPIVVDLETILQPIEFADSDASRPRFIMNLDYFAKTPLFTAMFDPAFLERSLNGSPLAIDLYADSNEKTVAFDSQDRLVVTKTAPSEATGHLPRLRGAVVPFHNYVGDMVSNFDRCAKLIARHRGELLDGLFADFFGGVEIRIIFRHTSTYSEVVKALHSAYAHQSVFQSEDLLSKLWPTVLLAPEMRSLIAAEYRDLWDGDVPYFSSPSTSTAVVDSRGTHFYGVIGRSGFDATKERLLAFSLAAIEKSAVCLEYCLRSRMQDGFRLAEQPRNVASDELSLPTERSALMKLIADRLIVDEDRVLFMDPIMSRDHTVSQGPLGLDFYSGLPGVCFALAYEDHFSAGSLNSEKIRRLAEIIFLRSDHDSLHQFGTCQGTGGLIYLASHLHSLWKNPRFAEIGVYLAERISKTIINDRHFDLFSGAAGALLSVCSLGDSVGTSRVSGSLDRIALHLVKHGIEDAKGRMAWLSSIPSDGPTSGFAHGVSGIGYALLRAYRHLDDPILLECAKKAKAFLDDCFLHDSRVFAETLAGEPSHIEAWCHGVPGISLFYSELASITQETPDRKVADQLAQRTRELARFENDSLCHGTLGNVDLPITMMRGPDYSRQFGAPWVEELAREYDTKPVKCGNERFHRSLSLFNGLTGMCYQRLRIDKKGALPSVLAFEGPVFHGH